MATHEEDVLFDLKEYFETNLGTYLTAIQTAKDDGVVLTDIKRYDVGDKDIYALNAYPAGLFFPDEIMFEPLSVGHDNMTLKIILTIVIKGGKTENLTLKVLRYAAAVRDLIDADRTAGSVVNRLAVSQTTFYARPPGIEDKMVVDIILETEKEIGR